MSENKPLRCQKCGKPLGYIDLTAKNMFQSKPSLDNVRLIGTCMECHGATGFYRRNLNSNPAIPF
ncbi:MAG: hypothetical protein ACQCN6_05590 [Candidatus Bathyarchaeia archaeon]